MLAIPYSEDKPNRPTTPLGLGCDCLRVHYCGHCLHEDREQVIREEFPNCPKHGPMTAKDLVTVYPEGHEHANA
jgi:hypothetical protein